MSNRLEYTGHSIAHFWYGPCTVSPALQRVVCGRRAYMFNQLPNSADLAALKHAGFEIPARAPTTTATPAPAGVVRIPHAVADLSTRDAFAVAQPDSP